MQVPLDGAGGATQECGNVINLVSLVVAHDKDGLLFLRQAIDGLNDALLLLGAFLNILIVGVVVAFLQGDVFHVVPVPAAAVTETGVGRNPVKPGVEIALELERGEIPPGLDKNFLINVFSIFLVPQQLQCQGHDPGIVHGHQFVERSLIASLGGSDQFNRFLVHVPPFTPA